MNIDVDAARSFVTTHGRLLERRRFDWLLDGGPADGVVDALDGYRNEDGGYGWGLEPDLRSPESQPAAAMHALEVLAEVGPEISRRSVELCDWLDAHSRPDGGMPLALTVTEPTGCASFWVDADAESSSLQMTTQVAANAHLVARHDEAVRDHPWLNQATEWCLGVIGGLHEAPLAHELLFAVRFLDAAAGVEPEAQTLLDRLWRFVSEDGVIPVQGGAEGEALRPLDLAPRPDGPVRHMFRDGVIDGELRRLADAQQADGGWTVDFPSASPAASLEWRAYTTVSAVSLLHGPRAQKI